MRTEYIPSGEYHVPVSGERLKLVALLGTCVGVAIFDQSAKVGGLCHILLPEPGNPSDVWQPKNYASTCLPLFVDELLQNGAHRDNLQAVVAGGSLCAPFSDRDLIMDIGGKNTETVFNFLNRHNIPIIKSETGGCHTMNMSITPHNSKVKIEHFQNSPTKPERQPESSPKPTYDEIDDAIKNTKPIPQVALKITRLLQVGNYNISEITKELINDQILTAKLLSFCNSSYYGFRSEIDSIERAVLLLGETTLIESVISSSLDSFFEQEQIGGYALLKGGLFRHSIVVGNLARVIARLSGRQDEQTAYTAGLLHDIGKVVLDNFVSQTQPFFYYSEQDKISDFIELEQMFFNENHQDIGKRLAMAWEIPENLTAVIANHHTPEQCNCDCDLVYIVNIADILASLFMAGIEVERINPDSFEDNLTHLGLTPQIIPDIIDQVPWSKLMSM